MPENLNAPTHTRILGWKRKQKIKNKNNVVQIYILWIKALWDLSSININEHRGKKIDKSHQ